ncbi:HNH endonuclease signature motif containing protein [Rhodococcus daqingensis]|uniref:DUF222 domain-containing protein n=1 Tax=Rhodococcus daqingensis TaxID=2479363 RepID=A0ABW2S4V4_9NOCA
MRTESHSPRSPTARYEPAGSNTSRPAIQVGNPVHEPRTAAKRRADALEDIIRGHLDAGRGPTEGGERPHVTITIDLDALVAALSVAAKEPATGSWGTNGWDYHSGTAYGPGAPASMPWLGPISPSIPPRLSCDAMVTAILVDSNRTPLDVGRTARIIPSRIRRALIARGCGCAFPGCGRPAEWTEGHHIWHWAKGGPTTLSNLVLLCRKHHTIIHKSTGT